MVRQLDAEQHQAEPRLQELFVGGGQMVGQALGLQVGEDAASSPVSQERAEVTTWRGVVVALVVRQGEGQVEVVSLRSTNITQHLLHLLRLQHPDVIYQLPLPLSLHYTTLVR